VTNIAACSKRAHPQGIRKSPHTSRLSDLGSGEANRRDDLVFKRCTANSILAGAGACAVVAFAPIAGAEDPPCDQRPPDQQQQCQQDQAAGIANQVEDALQQGQDSLQQGQDALQQGQDAPRQGLVKPLIDPATGKVNPGPTGLRVLINGVDTCLPVGVPAPLGADVRIVPGDMTGHCILGQ
jgi:hypothetical protein